MSQKAQRQGVGSALLRALIKVSEAEGYWSLAAEMIAANEASRLLHKKCGFREIGYREQVGHRRGVWHDVVLLERRSKVVGGPNLPTKVCGQS